MTQSIQKGIVAVSGIRVDHASDPEGVTGCSVVLCEKGAVGGVGQRAVRPAHTLFDGDTLFALSTGRKGAGVNLVGAYAAEVVAEAIVRAARAAASAGGLPSWRDLHVGG